eukprot:scaffold21692_cov36-Phaeocystis_antarctica.AAC.1
MGATVAPPKVPGRMAVLPQERPRCKGSEELMAFSSSTQSMARVPSRWCLACIALAELARAFAMSDSSVQS